VIKASSSDGDATDRRVAAAPPSDAAAPASAPADRARVAPSSRVATGPENGGSERGEPVRMAMRTVAAPPAKAPAADAPAAGRKPAATEARPATTKPAIEPATTEPATTEPTTGPGSGKDRPRAGKRTVIKDEFLVEGKLEKPSAYYILRRSSLDYDWARLDAKFSPLVLESVQDPLF
jgi:hypothetical protein